MRVLFISSGNKAEGIGTIVKNQGDSLIDIGVQLMFFTIKGKGLFSYLKNIMVLRKYYKVHEFDIFHAHYSLSAFTATLAGCKPLVVSLMGSDLKVGYIHKLIIRILAKWQWKNVIVKSESMKRGIHAKSSHVIPNGVNLDKVRPAAPSVNPSAEHIVLFASDPTRHAKNYSLAKEAVSLLDSSQFAQLKVVFSKKHSIILDEINNASVLLVTSLYEGSPNIIKEAMACNCPVVSTNVGDVKWLFGNEPGHFLTGFDPVDVAEKIKQAIAFSEQEGRTEGRQRIKKLGLDAVTVAEKVLDCYSSACHSGKNTINATHIYN